MKSAVFCTLAGTAIMMASTVDAHGQMLVPTYRPISAKYRQDCLWGLKGAGDDELQWSPLELLSKRGQADHPAVKTFKIYNGCRGTVYESGNTVTALTPGKAFDVKYIIHAPHPGTMVLSIAKPSTDSDGAIIYTAETQVGSYSNFGTTGGTYSVSATIPTSVTGCESAGDCALQFYWHSDMANQTYATCADITISGSGGTSTSQSTSTVAPTASSTDASAASSSSASTTQTTTAPTATTATPASETAGEASYNADNTAASQAATSTDASADTTQASGGDSSTPTTTDAPTSTDAPATDAPATVAPAPEVTSPPATTASSSQGDKCTVRRVRRVRQ
ncbi:Chitin-binding protein [Phytophthora cinnamomi]|uniref:Chitin-binding protein n=1 Tax=Phytophthora cinnamomi TaxID=4785 RepID=UPI00355A51A6|nr:Chitin-binding protein [Phytophthora cinnamomi]